MFLQPSCSKRGQSSCVNVAAELSDPKSVITPAKSAGNQRDLSGYKSGYNLDKPKKRQSKFFDHVSSKYINRKDQSASKVAILIPEPLAPAIH